MAKSTKLKDTTSFRETAFGILPRSKVVTLEKEGIKKAQQFILKLSEKKVKITPELILDIHRKGFGFIFPDWAGKFRSVDVTVGKYVPPHYSKIPEIISLLAWFQHRFVWIHPFNDYNGRVARLLTNLLTLNLDLPILTIKAETGRDRERYVKAMKAADKHDLSKLEYLIANTLKVNLEKV